MNAIIGMSELILREDTSLPVRENAANVRQAGMNLLSIINDILDFSKIESGKMEVVPREYWLASLLNDVINIIRMRLDEKAISFIVNIDKTLPKKLEGDEIRIRQILLNLLSNAVKYTKSGSVTFSARGEAVKSGEILLIFEVTDTGIGIKEEDMGQLFGDFTQFDSHVNKNVEGTGLGLAITKRLCQAMSGDIAVSSIYGEGSVFTATLPQKIKDSEPLGELGEYTFGLCAARDANIRFTAPGARILIVDDIATNLQVASGLLAPYEMTADVCNNGAEAVRMVRENAYDLVFMDHMMPDMDGVEAAAEIRALDGNYFKTVPIIALTANAISGMREMFLENGFNDYLSKPIEISKLNEIIERWIPPEKRHGTEKKAENEAVPREAFFEIDGLDIKRGIAMTGGTLGGYKRVLSMFRKDAEERLAFLRNPPAESELAAFVTQVHALKSVLASIGAADISAAAARLEAAGKAGELSFIRDALPVFVGHLAKLTEAIQAALVKDTDADARKAAEPVNGADCYPLLRELAGALEAENTRAIDRLLEELNRKPLDTHTRKSLEQISDHVLMAEFGAALKIIADMRKAK
jgi:CheY-like chemotaxis protein